MPPTPGKHLRTYKKFLCIAKSADGIRRAQEVLSSAPGQPGEHAEDAQRHEHPTPDAHLEWTTELLDATGLNDKNVPPGKINKNNVIDKQLIGYMVQSLKGARCQFRVSATARAQNFQRKFGQRFPCPKEVGDGECRDRCRPEPRRDRKSESQ